MPFLKLTIDQTGTASYAFPKLAGIITLYPIPNTSSLSSQLGSVFDAVSFDGLNGSQGDPLTLYPNFIFEFHFANGVSAIQITGNVGDSYTMFFSTQLPSVTNVHAYPVGTSFSAITGQSAPVATFQNDIDGFYEVTAPNINMNTTGSYIKISITLAPNDYIRIEDVVVGCEVSNYGNLFDSNLVDDINMIFNIWSSEGLKHLTIPPNSTYHGSTNRIFYDIDNTSNSPLSGYLDRLATYCLVVNINYNRSIVNNTNTPQTYFIQLQHGFGVNGIIGQVAIAMFYNGITNPASTITSSSSASSSGGGNGGGGYYPHGIRIG